MGPSNPRNVPSEYVAAPPCFEVRQKPLESPIQMCARNLRLMEFSSLA